MCIERRFSDLPFSLNFPLFWLAGKSYSHTPNRMCAWEEFGKRLLPLTFQEEVRMRVQYMCVPLFPYVCVFFYDCVVLMKYIIYSLASFMYSLEAILKVLLPNRKTSSSLYG